MSKFDGILSAKSSENVKAKPAAAPQAKVGKTNAAALTKKEESRRVGKRSDPDYTQVTAYLKKNTHEDVMRKIYKRQEFSELLEELLTDWLKKP